MKNEIGDVYKKKIYIVLEWAHEDVKVSNVITSKKKLWELLLKEGQPYTIKYGRLETGGEIDKYITSYSQLCKMLQDSYSLLIEVTGRRFKISEQTV